MIHDNEQTVSHFRLTRKGVGCPSEPEGSSDAAALSNPQRNCIFSFLSFLLSLSLLNLSSLLLELRSSFFALLSSQRLEVQVGMSAIQRILAPALAFIQYSCAVEAMHKNTVVSVVSTTMRLSLALYVSMSSLVCDHVDCYSLWADFIRNKVRVPSRALLMERVSVTVSRSYPSVEVTVSDLIAATAEYKDEFKRYKTLKDFVDGDEPWSTMHPILALSMGFRVEEGDAEGGESDALIRQNTDLSPVGWEGLSRIPDFSVTTMENAFFEQKLQNDLPEEEESTGLIIEMMVGVEMYKQSKKSKDPDVHRRQLIGKWLYAQGFLANQYPPRIRFIPSHLAANC